MIARIRFSRNDGSKCASMNMPVQNEPETKWTTVGLSASCSLAASAGPRATPPWA